MINVQLVDEGIENIRHFRYSHPDFRVQRSLQALYLNKSEYLQSSICDIGETTLANILQRFQKNGLPGLLHTNYRGQPSILEVWIVQIYFKNNCAV